MARDELVMEEMMGRREEGKGGGGIEQKGRRPGDVMRCVAGPGGRGGLARLLLGGVGL